jgi:hypothetical protein
MRSFSFTIYLYTLLLHSKILALQGSFIWCPLLGIKISASVCHVFASKLIAVSVFKMRYNWGTNFYQISINKDKMGKNEKPVKLLFYNNLTGFVCFVL